MVVSGLYRSSAAPKGRQSSAFSSSCGMARQVRTSRARVFHVVFIVFTFSFSASGAENSSNSANLTKHGAGSPLAGHLFSLLPAYPSFTESANARCRNDSIILRQQLEQFKLWAVKSKFDKLDDIVFS